ncbi:MAG TPA: hypothetical protein VG125_13125 [Pirellulales bacterium]|jgi:hypothetical protein|nr:hypothetical protein [Pirellulales bacterium]
MATIHAGEIWTLSLADKPRDVSVVAATGSPGWWRCVDLETAIAFVASERWFVGRVPAVASPDDCCDGQPLFL